MKNEDNGGIIELGISAFVSDQTHGGFPIISNNKRKMNTKIKSILMRFLKGIIAGAIASMSMVTITQPTIWADFGTLFNSLGLACAFGGLTGLLLALQKWASWTE